MMHPVVQEIEEARQAKQIGQAILFTTIAYQILTYQPPKREHWWQFWREHA